MKHYILTKFYPSAKLPLVNQTLFSKDCDVLDIALVHLKKYLLASLMNQSIKDFTLLLGINKDLNTLRSDIYEALIKLKDEVDFKLEVLDWFSYYDYVTEQDDPKVIATRIDHDDCFNKDALQIIQNQVNWNLDFKFFAFMSGAMMWTDKMYEIKEYISPTWKDGLSSVSASPTFFLNWDKCRLLPVHGHAKVTEITDIAGITLKPGINHFYDYETKLAWLYVRHGHNRSREVWYHHGDVVDISPEEVKKIFGIA